MTSSCHTQYVHHHFSISLDHVCYNETIKFDCSRNSDGTFSLRFLARTTTGHPCSPGQKTIPSEFLEQSNFIVLLCYSYPEVSEKWWWTYCQCHYDVIMTSLWHHAPTLLFSNCRLGVIFQIYVFVCFFGAILWGKSKNKLFLENFQFLPVSHGKIQNRRNIICINIFENLVGFEPAKPPFGNKRFNRLPIASSHFLWNICI